MSMQVKEVANLSGISVRTLHHYDEIGLLTPDEKSESGYRLYTDENIKTLQQILFYRELGFSLKKIKEIINSPSFDRKRALIEQQKMLYEKKSRLEKMIQTIDQTIKHEKGVIRMSNEEKFAGFDFSKNPYEQEARERWGDETIDKSNAKLAGLSKEDKGSLEESLNSIYGHLANLRHLSPGSKESQRAIKEWYDFLNNNFNHHYSLEAFKQLGQMYVEDERFTKNIDKFGDGLAQFMCEAMAIFADSEL